MRHILEKLVSKPGVSSVPSNDTIIDLKWAQNDEKQAGTHQDRRCLPQTSPGANMQHIFRRWAHSKPIISSGPFNSTVVDVDWVQYDENWGGTHQDWQVITRSTTHVSSIAHFGLTETCQWVRVGTRPKLTSTYCHEWNPDIQRNHFGREQCTGGSGEEKNKSLLRLWPLVTQWSNFGFTYKISLIMTFTFLWCDPRFPERRSTILKSSLTS